MSRRDDYPAGVPCWVETLQPDPQAALGFYGALFGPLDASPAGRFAVLADPTGAAFSVWEARDRAGAQLVNEPGCWAMSSLHTPDPRAASAFYGAVFGWGSEPIAPGAPLTLLRVP